MKQMKKLKIAEKNVRWKKEFIVNRDHYLMLLPFSVIFFMFMLIPVLTAMVLSFTDFNMLQMPKFNGIENYIRMFLDDDVFLIAVKTLCYLL